MSTSKRRAPLPEAIRLRAWDALWARLLRPGPSENGPHSPAERAGEAVEPPAPPPPENGGRRDGEQA